MYGGMFDVVDATWALIDQLEAQHAERHSMPRDLADDLREAAATVLTARLLDVHRKAGREDGHLFSSQACSSQFSAIPICMSDQTKYACKSCSSTEKWSDCLLSGVREHVDAARH